MNWAGKGGTLDSRHEIDTVRPISWQFAITPTLMPPSMVYRLTFDKFHWVAASDGRELIDCVQFLGAFSKIAGGQSC